MTLTPWGDSTELRARKLAPGLRLPPETVARNQRWRLLAAVMGAVADQGYDRTTISDIAVLSGVSKPAFYRQFANKEECFVAAVDATLRFAMTEVRAAYERERESGRKLDAAFEALVGELLSQPAAARVCLGEVYAAGASAVEHADRGAREFERMIGESYLLSGEQGQLPAPVVRAITGGAREVIARRLRHGREADLVEIAPHLSTWARTYAAPSVALRRSRARATVTPPPNVERDDAAARIMVALASVVSEKGYLATTLDDVAERAAMSFSTFYSHFATKEEAFLAAYDHGTTDAVAAARERYARESDWPRAIRSGLAGLLDHLGGQPEWADVGIVEVLAAGPRALERRDAAIAGFAALLEPGFERAPNVPRLAAEAIGGALSTMLYDQLQKRGAARLPELLPATTFVVLAPFVGVGEAASIANERGSVRSGS